MTPKVASMMREVAENMLRDVRRHPFILAPGTGSRGQHQNEAWCAEFEQTVQENEEKFWIKKIKDLDDRVKD